MILNRKHLKQNLRVRPSGVEHVESFNMNLSKERTWTFTGVSRGEHTFPLQAPPTDVCPSN